MKKILTSLVLASLFSAPSLTRADEVTKPITFTKITNSAVVTDLGEFAYCTWSDFNNDGFLDLFVANYDGRKNVFYRNDGDGTFTKIAQGDPVQDADNHVGAAAGDYDNDGNLDLLVSTGVGAPTARRNMLYHGNGDGTFARVSGGSVTNQLGWFGPSAWADYDNDGFLDLFIANHGDQNNDGGKNLLFHNNGDGTFNKITAGAVVNDVGVGFNVLWADYDNDGFEDLLVMNNTANAKNFLYRNNRNGTFTRVTTNEVGSDSWPQGATGATWGDYDNDGFQDLFVSSNAGTTNRLYRNNGDGTFKKITSGPMLSRPSGTDSSNGCAWGDYDNDGYLDLFINSHNGHNRLFHNNGDGTFTEILTANPAKDGGSGISSVVCSWVDYDNNGFLDLFITRLTDSGTPISNLLYHNDGNTNTWIEVKLVGTASNRSAIGAKVHVHATIGGKPLVQLHEINNGGGAWVQPLVAHFGLGDATNVDTLRIEWPSGTVQEFQNLPSNKILTITEPPRLLATATNGIPQFSLKGGRGFQYDLQFSTNLVIWPPLTTVIITNLNGTVQITDPNAAGSSQRFYRAVFQP